MSMRSPTQTKAESSFIPVQTGLLQRKCATCGQHTLTGGDCTESQSERSSPLQHRSANQAEVFKVPPIVHEVLAASGQPLDPNTRVLMESRFGRDFSQVQIHADTRAAESAEAMNALAYTIGNTVVFGPGKYVPSSSKGLHLLAHELAHVIQQQQAGTGVQAEQRAGAAAEQVTRGQSVASSALGGAPVGLYTAPDDDKLSESSQKGMFDFKFKPLDPSLLTPNLNLATFDKFALNSAKLPDEFKATVIKELADKILYLLQKMPEGKVVLTGHTDDTGSNDYNMNLGLERAKSARQVLVDAKVPEESIQIKSEGMTGKRVPTKGLEPLNRRVEVGFEGKLSSLPTPLIPPYTPPSPLPVTPIRPPINLNLPPMPAKSEKEMLEERINQMLKDAIAGRDIPPIPKGMEPKSSLDLIKRGVAEAVKPLIKDLPKNVRDFILDKVDSAVEKGVTSIIDAAVDPLKVDEKTKEAIKKAAEAGIKLKPGLPK